jgi:homoserine dehydrogenase
MGLNHKADIGQQPDRTLVVGLGEVGGAIAAILERNETILRHDIEPVEIREPIGVRRSSFKMLRCYTPRDSDQNSRSFTVQYCPELRARLERRAALRLRTVPFGENTFAWRKIFCVMRSLSPHLR